jgi:hypothetical protein
MPVEQPTGNDESNLRPEAARKELIDLLEFEIDRLTEEQKQPGWTKWALAAAAGAMLWAGCSLFEPPTEPNIKIVAYLFILLAITFDALRAGTALMSPDTPVPVGSRFRLANDLLGRSRSRIMYQVFRFVVIGYVAWALLDTRYLWANRALEMYCVFMSVSGLALIVFSFANIPISVRPVPPLKARFFGGACITVVLAASLYGLIARLSDRSVTPSTREWKLAAIAIGLTIILDLFLSSGHDVPLFEAFVDLRRKLATSEIDYEAARTQFTIAVRGLAAEHILQRHVEVILGKLRSCVSELSYVFSQLTALKNQFERNPQIPVEEKKSLLDAVEKSLDARLDQALSDINAAGPESNELLRRARWIAMSAPEARSDVSEILDELRSATAKTKADVTNRRSEIEKLRAWLREQESLPPANAQK